MGWGGSNFVFLVNNGTSNLIDIRLGDGAGGGTEQFIIDGAALQNATVDGEKLVNGSVSDTAFAQNSNHDYCTTSTATSTTHFTQLDLATSSVTVGTGDVVRIEVNYEMGSEAGAFNWSYFTERIKRGTTTIRTAERQHSSNQASGVASQNMIGQAKIKRDNYTVIFYDQPSNGSYTYELEIAPRTVLGSVSEGVNTGKSLTFNIFDATILVQVLKQGPNNI